MVGEEGLALVVVFDFPPHPSTSLLPSPPLLSSPLLSPPLLSSLPSDAGINCMGCGCLLSPGRVEELIGGNLALCNKLSHFRVQEYVKVS